MKYIALLRGINVGGKSLIKMADLRSCFDGLGFNNVRTYINSGNVLFEASKQDTLTIAKTIEQGIERGFPFPVRVVVISESSYRRMIQDVPKSWGTKPGWKYNLLFLIPPYDIDEIVADIGELKPDIEIVKVGEGVIYQAVLFSSFGRTTTGKLASKMSYKTMTIRNWNTARKLALMLDE